MNRQVENNGLVITKALYGNRKKIKESGELNEIDDDVASQVFDVTIPLNFLVTEAGQLKVYFSYIADKCFYMRYETST
jgi:DnaJ family protein C protein 11